MSELAQQRELEDALNNTFLYKTTIDGRSRARDVILPTFPSSTNVKVIHLVVGTPE